MHLSHIGCPICGDYLYGRELPELKDRFALHSARLRCVHVADEEVVVRAVVDGQHNVRAAEGFRFGEILRRVVGADGNVRQVGDVNGVAPLADFALVIAGAERAEHQRLVEVLLKARRPNLGDEAGNSHMVLISFR